MIFKNKKHFHLLFLGTGPSHLILPVFVYMLHVVVSVCACVWSTHWGAGVPVGGSLLPGLWERAQLASSSLSLLSSFSHAFTLIPSCQLPAQPRSCGDAVCSWGWRGRQKNPTPTSIHRHMCHGHQIMRGWKKLMHLFFCFICRLLFGCAGLGMLTRRVFLWKDVLEKKKETQTFLSSSWNMPYVLSNSISKPLKHY